MNNSRENKTVGFWELAVTMFLSLIISEVALAQSKEPAGTVMCDSMIVTNLSVVSPAYDGVNILGVITNNSTLLHRGVAVVGES